MELILYRLIWGEPLKFLFAFQYPPQTLMWRCSTAKFFVSNLPWQPHIHDEADYTDTSNYTDTSISFGSCMLWQSHSYQGWSNSLLVSLLDHLLSRGFCNFDNLHICQEFISLFSFCDIAMLYYSKLYQIIFIK